MPQQKTSVIIVGGGPVGLSCSILLSLRGIPNQLFERHPQTSIHPKACGINQRTVEIFRIMGIEDEAYQHAAPPHIAGRTAWYTGFGNEGREIISRDAWGGGKYAEEYASFSYCRYCILPQIRLEPILKRRAVALNPDGIFYNAEVNDIHQDDTDAWVDVHYRYTGHVEQHHARYVIVADGGRMFTDRLGVSWAGERDLFEMVTAHFRAPLRPLHPDPRNFITWFSNPEMGGSTRTGYLYQIGPWPSRSPEEDEWVFVCGKVDGDPAQFDEASMIQRMRKTIQIPDLPVEMLSFSHWTVNAIYAEKWQVGRAFLVGDSAHRIPPWGALGMNSGIQDAQNLVWKLELALEDEKRYAGLLESYQAERLDVGRRVGLTSLHNMRTHSKVMDGALGIDATKSPAANKQAAAAFFDPNDPDYQVKQAAAQHAQKVLDSEFKAPGFEIGWFYPSADINNEGGETHGGQQLPDGTLVSEFYFPSTVPGHHLPHVWLHRGSQKVATRDLLRLSQLTLFAEQRFLAVQKDSRVALEIVGSQGWHETSGEWLRLCGVGSSGGVLVRPDGIVAWRGDLKYYTAQSWSGLIDSILCCESKD